MDNDANLFALGEHWMGAGQGYDQMLGITLGTGVGGGLILNGALWQGTAGTSGEVGHITVDPEGEKCHCGNRGCLETMASATWTTAWVKKELAQGASSWLKELWQTDPEAIIGETLVTAARMLDPLALKAFVRVGRALGMAIADVVHLLGACPGGDRRALRQVVGTFLHAPGRRALPAADAVPAGGGVGGAGQAG